MVSAAPPRTRRHRRGAPPRARHRASLHRGRTAVRSSRRRTLCCIAAATAAHQRPLTPTSQEVCAPGSFAGSSSSCEFDVLINKLLPRHDFWCARRPTHHSFSCVLCVRRPLRDAGPSPDWKLVSHYTRQAVRDAGTAATIATLFVKECAVLNAALEPQMFLGGASMHLQLRAAQPAAQRWRRCRYWWARPAAARPLPPRSSSRRRAASPPTPARRRTRSPPVRPRATSRASPPHTRAETGQRMRARSPRHVSAPPRVSAHVHVTCCTV